MPSKPRAGRPARQASITTTSVSRKLTKKPAKPAAKGKKPSKSGRLLSGGASQKKSEKTRLKKKSPVAKATPAPGLRSEEMVALIGRTASTAPTWQSWLEGSSELASSAWAMQAIQFAESAMSAGLASPERATIVSELLKVVEEANGLAVEANALTHQLLRGELRVKLGAATNDVALAQVGLLTVVEGLQVLLDGEGVPHKKYLEEFPELAACWHRTLRLARRKKFDPPFLTPEQTEALAQCKWLPLRLAQLSRGDGIAIFCAGDHSRIRTQLIEDSAKFWCDAKERRDVACLLGEAKKPAVEKQARALCGDWSGIAVFRSEPKPGAAYLAVAFDDSQYLMELGCKSTPLLSGEAALKLSRDGHSLAPTGVWEEVCRHQEPQVEYWELERTYERGVWLQRQVILSTRDQMAYVCDNVVADGVGSLAYSLELPLAPSVTAAPAAETREVILSLGKSQAAVIPLSAEEWRTTPTYFDLQGDMRALTFSGAAKAQRMAIAWAVDLRGGRKLEELTWRHLRVAENLQNLPRDLAVAYRWQIGPDQWMAYRSLAAPSNRTVLGQNLVGDFLLARVSTEGKTKTIVEIE